MKMLYSCALARQCRGALRSTPTDDQTDPSWFWPHVEIEAVEMAGMRAAVFGERSPEISQGIFEALPSLGGLGEGTPKASCSKSFHPVPMPRSNRPPDI